MGKLRRKLYENPLKVILGCIFAIYLATVFYEKRQYKFSENPDI